MERTKPLPRSTATSVENEIQLSPDLARVFTYQELKEATGNFKQELGRGSYGTVYTGKLKDGRMVAVKEITERNQKQREQFINEVNVLSCLELENLVCLYGFTNMDKDLLLVYGLVPNGTLWDHLHGLLTPLTLSVRIDIAIGTAKALSHLHSRDPQIVHLNVKPASILLDHSFHVKVAGFSLCRHLPQDKELSTLTQSTLGYEDPEYQQYLTLTDKSDVYSFGVVLVELISRKKAVDVERSSHGEEIYLNLMALNKIRRNKLGQLVDPELGYDDNLDVKRIIRSVARLVRRCLEPKRKDRPLMREVLEDLERIRKEMQETYQLTSDAHIPRFGDWESGANAPYTEDFEKVVHKVRSEEKLVKYDENLDALSKDETPARVSLHSTGSETEASKHKDESQTSAKDTEQPPGSPRPVETVAPKPSPHSPRYIIGDQATSGDPDRKMQKANDEANRSIEHSPLHPQYQVKSAGRGGAASPWERKGPAEKGHGPPTTPGRPKLRTVGQSDDMPEKSATIPKFGEWGDENNPSSAETYSDIFNKVREERQGGDAKLPMFSSGSKYLYGKKDKSFLSKSCSCCSWGKT